MDRREKIDIICEDIQTKLENRIGRTPCDLDAIEELWHIQTLRYENALRMTDNTLPERTH